MLNKPRAGAGVTASFVLNQIELPLSLKRPLENKLETEYANMFSPNLHATQTIKTLNHE